MTRNYVPSKHSYVSAMDAVGVFRTDEELYDKLISVSDSNIKRKIDQMVAFDFITNNIDRHARNFGFILNEESIPVDFAPLIDHGQSLLNGYSDNELSRNMRKILNHNRGHEQGFGSLAGSLDMTDKDNLNCLELDKPLEDLFSELSVFEDVLGTLRFKAMKNLVEGRCRYVSRFCNS